MHPHLSLLILLTTTIIFSALLSHAGPLSSPLPSPPSSSSYSSSSSSNLRPPTSSPNSTITISTPSTNTLLLPRDRQDRILHPEFPYARCFCRLRPPWKCWIYNIVNTPGGNDDGAQVIARLEKNLSQCSRFVRLAKWYDGGSLSPTGEEEGGGGKGGKKRKKFGLTPMAMFRVPVHVKKSCVEMAVNEATGVKNGVGCIFSRLRNGGNSTGQEPY